eukprot:COSAG02_NODE_3395_length_6814_cov_8.576620_1_plen_70_part_10
MPRANALLCDVLFVDGSDESIEVAVTEASGTATSAAAGGTAAAALLPPRMNDQADHVPPVAASSIADGPD